MAAPIPEARRRDRAVEQPGERVHDHGQRAAGERVHLRAEGDESVELRGVCGGRGGRGVCWLWVEGGGDGA